MSEQWRPRVNPWLIAAAVMLATFMEVLDTSIASVALPYIGGNLGATPSEATWVLTSYLVSNAIVLPASGWLSRHFGRKRLLITCIIIFSFASLLCGAATSLPMLIVRACAPGRGRRRAPAAGAIHHAGKFSAGQTRHGHGRLWHRSGVRAHPGADSGRLADRYLVVALGLLHQFARQHPGGDYDHALCG